MGRFRGLEHRRLLIVRPSIDDAGHVDGHFQRFVVGMVNMAFFVVVNTIIFVVISAAAVAPAASLTVEGLSQELTPVSML